MLENRRLSSRRDRPTYSGRHSWRRLKPANDWDDEASSLTRFAEQIPKELPNGVKHFSYIPFSQLLPRAAALVVMAGSGRPAGPFSRSSTIGDAPGARSVRQCRPSEATRGGRLDRSIPLPWPVGHTPELNALIGSGAVRGACREVSGRFAGKNGVATAADTIERFAGRR